MRTVIAGLALFLATCTVGAEGQINGARPYVRGLVNSGGTFCSAVVLRPGLVLTAHHCMDGESAVRLTPGGTVGTVVAPGDMQYDLSLVMFPEAEAPCPCARLAETEAGVDEPVVTIGYPRGITQVVTFGTSQGVVNNDALPYGGPRLVSTAPVTGGNSGGGTFVYRANEYQLVGILVEGIDSVALSMPVISIQQFLQPAL